MMRSSAIEMKPPVVVLSNDRVPPSIYDPNFLLQQARWIRDDLDPQVARDGPDILQSDDILTLDEFLRRLLVSDVRLEDIRYSRLHLAIGGISGKATRWPRKLIEKSDQLQAVWEARYGPLRETVTPLYEPGGRLYGICRPEDLSKERLIVRWLKSPAVKLSPLQARRVGGLGFNPGDWWISSLFAFRDGIIDTAEKTGGIVADANGAYAILMTDDEEVEGESPDSFTYRARNYDRGRYRLTSATRDSRQPVRILRSHSLHSFWAPKAGVRYDGLYRVIGWRINPDLKKGPVYEIQFNRLASETCMDLVLRRPYADEIEDYKEYKRLRQVSRRKQADAALKTAVQSREPAVVVSADGVKEVNDQPDSELALWSVQNHLSASFLEDDHYWA